MVKQLVHALCMVWASVLPSGLAAQYFRIDGKITVPEQYGFENWLTDVRVLFNYGQYIAFLKRDGSFEAYLPTGSYVTEVSSKDLLFEPVRLDVSPRGNARARKLQLLQPKAVQQLPYPLRLSPRAPAKYFQVRETWRLTDFLLSPMVLMMVLPLLLIMVLPQLVDTSDPEVQREMRESLKMPKYDMPDISEFMADYFGGGKKPKKAIKHKK